MFDSRKKFELVTIENREVSFDISALLKTEEVWFNATEVAKQFGKQPSDWLRQEENKSYLDALSKTEDSPNKNFVKISKGRYGGTWFHRDLAIVFARWLDPIFAVRLDRAILKLVETGRQWKIERHEAKTGYLPMSQAVEKNHDPVKFYHYSNEADMINRIVLGMTSKQYKELNGVEDIRDSCCNAELMAISKMQIINTGLLEIGMGYNDRQKHLAVWFEREFGYLLIEDK